jgi:hypothetical protein
MKTRHLIMTCALTAAALAPLPLAAQQSGGAAAAHAAADARIEAALAAAVEAGIPAALVERKVAEGRAKGVAAARIATAVEARLGALLQARDALQRAHIETTTAADLSIAADAIQAGVSESALVEISRRAPQERRALAVAVLANLVALGHGSEHALVQVRGALGRGPDALVHLQARSAAELKARGGAGVEVKGGVDAGLKVDLRRGKPPGKPGRGGS